MAFRGCREGFSAGPAPLQKLGDVNSEIRRRGRWKRGICIKLSEIDFQICDNFAHPSSDVRNKSPANFAQIWRTICDKFAQRPLRERPLLGFSDKCPGHLKPVILKLVGRMSILGELTSQGWSLGASSDPFCASKQGWQALGSELLGQSLRIFRTEKWPKTGHADDWVYCHRV